MNEPQRHDPDAPRIQTPCRKRWDELEGDGARRFCHECRLHVHDGSRMTRDEARALVARATDRVCMRFELDDHGEPKFRETRRPGAWVRLARWAVSSAVGALAACSGAADVDSAPTASEPPSKMGKVCAPEILGDVGPGQTPPADAPPAGAPLEEPPLEVLGEVYAPPTQFAPTSEPHADPQLDSNRAPGPNQAPGSSPGSGEPTTTPERESRGDS